MAETGDGAKNQARVDVAGFFVAKAEPFHGARPEVFHQHVRRRDQPFQDFQPVGVLEVQCQASLVAVDAHEIGALAVDERRAIGAGVVPGARALHLHHVGAHVGE